jgi:multidrug resistance protein, MATE family
MAFATAGQAAMGLVDTAVCGRAGAVVLAGTGLGNTVFFAVSIFGLGLVMGTDPLVAQAIGAGDRRGARRFFWQGSWLALFAGVTLAIPCAAAALLLRPIGIEEAVSRQAMRFILARAPSLPAFLFFIVARAYLQGLGLTRALVVSTAVANVANLLLDLLLVYGGASLPVALAPLRAIPPLGSLGAGLSTSVVTLLQAFVLALAVRRAGGDRLAGGLSRPNRPDIERALRVGFPIGLHMAAEVGVFALVGLIAGRLGREAVAAHQVALTLASFTFTFALGIGNAAAVRVGWAVGANDRARARRSGLIAFAAGAGVMCLGAAAFALLPNSLARLMTDDRSVAKVASRLLLVAAVFQVADGVQAVGAGVLRGAGDTRFTFAANVVGHWFVGLPLAIALGLAGPYGVRGLWWGLCLGLAAVACSLLARFLWLSSRVMEPLVERAAEA